MAKTVIAKFDESLRERIKRGYGRLKSYRRGRALVGAKFCLCDTDAQNFIFRAAESAFKFKFLARTGQTVRILGALNLDCRGV
ncbi:hypothetical protein [uncultured Campylobacter sp.]|uniref:hypothetical protein n=1 Tax=uncultured Campylobacter sp. TaxID=218934 RepID=UPI00263A218E|nr:hypothetical protein [uncultured Campylobacter sp.]